MKPCTRIFGSQCICHIGADRLRLWLIGLVSFVAICGLELAVEVVDGLAGGLGYRASGILHRASNLIRDTLIGEI